MRLFLLFLFSTFFLNSQEYLDYDLVVNYQIDCDTKIKTSLKGSLHIDKSLSKSLFFYGKNTDKKVIKNEDDDATLAIFLGGIEKINYVNFYSDSLYTKDKFFKTFIVKESLPKLNWILTDEEKIKNNLVLKKAKLNFRGRNYIAWYTIDYPIPFGPWKFSGLPGLIVEIYDETKRYHWYAKSIKKVDGQSKIDIKKLFEGIEQINIKEYVERRYNNKNNFINKSRLPRGAVITQGKIPRNGFEIKFEWEENTIKN